MLTFRPHARRILRAGLLGMLLAPGCKTFPTLEVELPFGHTGWIEIAEVRVVEGAAPALAATFIARKDQPVWVRLTIDGVDDERGCEDEFQLDPYTRYPFRCPQVSLAAGMRYRAELVVYKDIGDTHIAERIRRHLEILASEGGGLELAGRPAD